jgi:hypothetical protein
MTASVQEIISDYTLLCFDIPQNQGKLRKLILRRISEIGGHMATASVYYLPYSDKTLSLANDIAKVGDVVVWRSQQLNPKKAEALTMEYDQHIFNRCQLIDTRFVMIKDYIQFGQFGRANLMIQKTNYLIGQIKTISKTFNPPWLGEKLAEFDGLLDQLINKKAAEETNG